MPAVVQPLLFKRAGLYYGTRESAVLVLTRSYYITLPESKPALEKLYPYFHYFEKQTNLCRWCAFEGRAWQSMSALSTRCLARASALPPGGRSMACLQDTPSPRFPRLPLRCVGLASPLMTWRAVGSQVGITRAQGVTGFDPRRL